MRARCANAHVQVHVHVRGTRDYCRHVDGEAPANDELERSSTPVSGSFARARARQRSLRSDADGREGVTDARTDLRLRRTYATPGTARPTCRDSRDSRHVAPATHLRFSEVRVRARAGERDRTTTRRGCVASFRRFSSPTWRRTLCIKDAPAVTESTFAYLCRSV